MSDETIYDKSIGAYLKEAKNLSEAQIDEVLEYQRVNPVRFGEAAVALRLVSGDDVLWALSRQFHYPFASTTAAQQLDSELVAAADPFSDMAEVFRAIRSQLLSDPSKIGWAKKALAVVSANVQDGKTFFAANMAVSFSQLGSKTLLVDADMRTPRLHKIFGLRASSGLSAMLSGRPQSNVIHQVDSLPSLYILPVGAVPPNPLELIQRPAFSLLMSELTTRFDQVIVDTPASSHGADSRVIAAKCGAAVIIGRRNSTSMNVLRALTTALSRQGVVIGGLIMNESRATGRRA